MTDIVDIKRRSQLMASIRGRDAAPELAVRLPVRRIGPRFRLHYKNLLGCSTGMSATMDGTAVRPHMARMSQARPFRSRAIPMAVVPAASLPLWMILREHRSHPDDRGVTACGRSQSATMRHRNTMTVIS